MAVWIGFADHTFALSQTVLADSTEWDRALDELRRVDPTSVAHSLSKRFPNFLDSYRFTALVEELHESGNGALSAQITQRKANVADMLGTTYLVVSFAPVQ